MSAAPPAIEFYVKVKGHYDFDVTDPADVKQVYVVRSTVTKLVLSEEGIADTMAERGVPYKRAIEDLVIESLRNVVRPEDIVSISSDNPSALERVSELYGVKRAGLGPEAMSDPRHVKPLNRSEVSDA